MSISLKRRAVATKSFPPFIIIQCTCFIALSDESQIMPLTYLVESSQAKKSSSSTNKPKSKPKPKKKSTHSTSTTKTQPKKNFKTLTKVVKKTKPQPKLPVVKSIKF